MLPGLIAATSCYINKSKLSVYSSLSYNLSEYCILVGFPGNGRTAGINYIKNAMVKLEEYNNVIFEDSLIREPTNNVSLMTSLNENSTLIGSRLLNIVRNF
jgi:hypothetical protein